MSPRAKTWTKRVVAGVFVLGSFAAIWAFLVEPRRLVVHAHDLALPGWPREQAPLRVALVSDLHVGSPHWGADRLPVLVEAVNATQPDVVLLAGDYMIDGVKLGTKTPPEAIAQGLAGLRSRHGTIAVLGNHDWWNDGARVRRAFEAEGIVVLENEVRTFVHEGRPVTVAGLADTMTRSPEPDATFARAPAGPVIALVHEPDIFRFDVGARPSITLAGHTHGGQVWVPFLGHPVIPSDYGQRYAGGHVVEEGRHLFVTTGVGTSIYPVRFGVPPEIALLTLRGE
ncbi:MAG: metallophosphoesterase [Labilithrix sp.]|nr:metallophosphoesterase [Labilithrix sp.]MCW5809795.1 metallophosphoesterase [Labilithrix sp.]